MLFNAGAWGLKQNQIQALEAFHRKHLRIIIGSKWPHKISNIKLYAACGVAEPLKATIAELHWKLFGYVLRMDQEAPAQRAMSFYYSQGAGMRVRPQNTLPVMLAGGSKISFQYKNRTQR